MINNVLDDEYSTSRHFFCHTYLSSFKNKGLYLFSKHMNPVSVHWSWSWQPKYNKWTSKIQKQTRQLYACVAHPITTYMFIMKVSLIFWLTQVNNSLLLCSLMILIRTASMLCLTQTYVLQYNILINFHGKFPIIYFFNISVVLVLNYKQIFNDLT